MQFHAPSLSRRVQSMLCALTVTAGLTLAPALALSASANELPPAPIECSAAKAAWQQAVRQQQAAHAAALAATKAVAKSRAAHQSATRQQALKNIQLSASKRYWAKTSTSKVRHTRMGYACSAPTSAVRAYGAGKTLALLAIASGLDVGAINAAQLTALIEQFLPGIAGDLDAGQLTALLKGFNTGTDLDPTQVLGLLGGLFSPDQITAILGGVASPEVVTTLLATLLGQLSGLGGGLPIPGELDLAGILETVTGILGSGGLPDLCALVPIPVLCA